MKVYTKPEIEVIEQDMILPILAGSDWGTQNEGQGGPEQGEQGGEDGPAPTNTISIWED